MEPLTALERAALDAIASEMASDRAKTARDMLARAVVVSRENTGGGFFSNLQLDASKLPRGHRHLGDNVWVSVEGLDYGLGMILHLEDDHRAMLEGYAVGPEDTSKIAFVHVPFAITAAPGPLIANGS